MLQINKKLKQAREKAGFTQKQLAEWMQLSAHSVISAYENGTKKGISEEYIDFLIAHKFDLNTLFDVTKELEQLPEEGENRYKQLEPVAHYMTEPKNENDDRFIALLQQQVESLTTDKLEMQKTIDELQEQLRFMRSNTDGRAKSA